VEASSCCGNGPERPVESERRRRYEKTNLREDGMSV